MYPYAYLVGNAFFLGLWVLLFFLRPQSRRLMLCTSLALAHGGLVFANWYLLDYWSPEFTWATQVNGFVLSLDDYLFSFSFSGLAVCCFGPRHGRTGARTSSMVSMSVVVLRLQAALAAALLAVSVLIIGFQMNSVHATVWVCMIGGMAILVHRPAWTRNAIWSAGLGAVLFVLLYKGILLPLYPDLFSAWWHPALLDGYALYGIPVEEFLWAGSVMFFLGPLAHWTAEWNFVAVRQRTDATSGRWLRAFGVDSSY